MAYVRKHESKDWLIPRAELFSLMAPWIVTRKAQWIVTSKAKGKKKFREDFVEQLDATLRGHPGLASAVKLWKGDKPVELQHNIRSLLLLVRVILGVEPGNINLALTICGEGRLDEYVRNHLPKASMLDDLMHAFRLIGRQHHPSDGEEDVVYNAGKQAKFSTTNPVKGGWFNKRKKMMLRDAAVAYDANDKGDGGSKRAAPLLAFIMAIAACHVAVCDLLKKGGGNTIRSSGFQKMRLEIIRRCLTVVALVMQLMRVSRGKEVCTASFADLTYKVEGMGDVPVVVRALLPPGCLPRATQMNEMTWKGKKAKRFLHLIHDALPLFASALSLPDVLVWAFRIILMLEPGYLDPAVNPGLLVFMAPDNKGRLVPLTTTTLNNWLKWYMPKRAVMGRWLTSYSARSSLAKAVVSRGLVTLGGHTDLDKMLREWFGHSPDSKQILEYARTTKCVNITPRITGEASSEEMEDAASDTSDASSDTASDSTSEASSA